MIYAFAECELDTGRHVLSRAGEEQKIEPQAFDVLVHLAENRGRMITKEELLDEIWGDRFVSESALTSRIKSVRRLVGDDGRTQGIIRTIHGRGYEFVAPVTVRDQDDIASPAADGGPLPRSGPVRGLIGREDLLVRLESELTSSRLLTLVGPAGVGKTSVALALAAAVADGYADGVWPVELAAATVPDAAIQVLATTLDMKSQQEQSLADTIVEMLGPRQALLVLDNCEHVIEPISSIAEAILKLAPGVQIIATSREALATPSEQLWPIDPFPVLLDDDVDAARLAQNPAVKLFVERAQAGDPHFELTDANAAAVAEVCRRLDGIPLAIELAAARQRSMDVTDLAERLNERFRLLTAVRRGSNERHQTLQNAVRWSYDLLSSDEQQVFDSLSVFAGSFSLDAAESVFGAESGDAVDILDPLGRLVERSMLTMVRSESGGTRYEMLETMREFGRGQLNDDATLALHRRHRTHFSELTERIESSLSGPDEGRWSETADRSLADLRAAQRFAVDTGDVDTALGMINRLCEYAMRAMRYEVLAWIGPALALPGASDHPLYGHVLAVQGYGAWVRGEYDLATRLANTALEETDSRGLARSPLPYRVLGNVSYQLGDTEAGQVNTGLMLELAREMGEPSRIIHAAYMHSIALSSSGDSDKARLLVEMAGQASRETLNPTDLASVAVARAFSLEDDVEAIACCRQAVEAATTARNRWMTAFAETLLFGRLMARGELGAARAGLGRVVETWHRSGDWSQLWLTLTHSAMALRDLGADELAVQVIGSTDHHASYAATPLTASLRRDALDVADELRARLGADRYEALWGEGVAAPVSDLVHRVRITLVAGSGAESNR